MLAGLLIGMGIVLPGVSGGVIAVILNVYDKIIFSVNNFFENKKENGIFLAKIIVSIIIGAIVSAKLLSYFFNKYLIEMSYLFIGMVLGTVPLIINTYKEKSDKQLNYIVIIVVMILSVLLSIFLKGDAISTKKSFLNLFFSGVLFITGKVVPGLSSSVLLTMIGRYDLLLSVFSNPIKFVTSNFSDFIVISFGILIGFIVSMKMITYLLNKYYSLTYSIIIGFTIGSVVSLYPNEVTFAGIMFFLIGLILSFGVPLFKK